MQAADTLGPLYRQILTNLDAGLILRTALYAKLTQSTKCQQQIVCDVALG